MNRIIDCGAERDHVVRGERSWTGWVKFDDQTIIKSPLTEEHVAKLWASATMLRINSNQGK